MVFGAAIGARIPGDRRRATAALTSKFGLIMLSLLTPESISKRLVLGSISALHRRTIHEARADLPYL